jgi:nicotinamidase-related amidase
MALVVVDVQDGLDDPHYGLRNNPEAEVRIAELLAGCRARRLPVIFAQYISRRPDSPLREGAPGSSIKRIVAPTAGERVVRKWANSVFTGTHLAEDLKSSTVRNLVLVGIATDACVSTSAREAKDLGFGVVVINDACATFDRKSIHGPILPASLVHEVELSVLQAAGICIRSTSEMLRLLDPAPADQNAI